LSFKEIKNMEMNDNMKKIYQCMDKLLDEEEPIESEIGLKIIKQLNDICVKTGLYQREKNRNDDLIRDKEPEEIYETLMIKISIAPTSVHAVVTVIMLVPVLYKTLVKKGKYKKRRKNFIEKR
jgi:hypothetical protein